MTLKRWDGKISYVRETTLTMTETGNQYEVSVYRVVPVLYGGGEYLAVEMEISVAKDSGKIFNVDPRF
ncbi:MAG: hypothetical protein HQM16_11200 [Deltaproteobacteria bacterium]|nr:hypothetical protein [Deltaproteobacteria bacterium]